MRHGKQSRFIAHVYDVLPGMRPHERHCVRIMDVVVYLPSVAVSTTATTATPRTLTYTDAHGCEMAFRFSGVRTAPSDEQLRRLCMRLSIVRGGLVDFIRELAENATGGSEWKR